MKNYPTESKISTQRKYLQSQSFLIYLYSIKKIRHVKEDRCDKKEEDIGQSKMQLIRLKR